MLGGTVLSVENLSVEFRSRRRVVRAVSDVSFTLKAGETFALVGESGSGKSVTSLAIMRLLAVPAGRITGGSVKLTTFDGVLDLTRLPEGAMRAVRGRRIAMIFQEPMTSLNPLFTIGDQIAEVARHHLGTAPAEAFEGAIHLLDRVGIPAPAHRARAYPHELSGGMRQRAMIAMALACKPLVMIADEPTTALDVTVQAQMLDLIRDLQDETGMAVLFITHNLNVVAEIAQDLAVMYGGEIVETGKAAAIFTNPCHPYTRGLLDSLPPELDDNRPIRSRLKAIPGSMVDLASLPSGCRFAARCEARIAQCEAAAIPLGTIESGRTARCIRAGEDR